MTRKIAVVLVLVLGVFGVAQAQTTGSIAGQVVDAQGLPTPGATVTVTSAQGSKVYTTGAEGRFYAPFLTPAVYSVRVELQGFKPLERSDIVVRLSQQVDLTLPLELGGVTAVVQVVGQAPVVDMTTTTPRGALDEELLRSVPIGRRVSDTLFILPSVSDSGGVGEANPSISGASGLENQYIVDGVNISNAGFGALGSYSIVFGSLGNAIPFDFIKEVQVKGAGFEPEFGQTTGGVVNVITKSGSNLLTGSVFGYVRPEQLESDWTVVQTVNGTVNTEDTRLWDSGVEIGGPLVKNRLFGFAAIDPTFEKTTLLAPEGFPLASLGPVDRDRQILPYAVKATYQATANHRIEASFFGDPADGDMGPQRTSALLRTDTAGFSELSQYGGHNVKVGWDGVVGSSWLLEASFARAVNAVEEAPSVNAWSVTDRTVTPNIFSGGIGFFEQRNDQENLQYQVKSSNLFSAAGSHQLRYGLTYEDIQYDSKIDRTGPTFVLPNGVRTTTGAQINVLADPNFGRIYRVSRANITNVRESSQDYLSLFVQDTWQAGNRLTIQGGLRWDRQELTGNLADFTWDENYAPRIGASYDPTGSGKSKIFGHWGRFYAKIPNDLAVRALSADAAVTRADYFDANLTQPVPNGLLAAGSTTHFIQSGLEASDFDPDSNSTSLDEWVAGAEYEAWQGVTLGARYTRRRFNDILEDTGNTSATLFFSNPALAGNSVEFLITNPDDGFPATVAGIGAHEEPIHEYDAIEVTADKRFGGRWGLQTSYRWARLEGTFEGFFRNDNGQSDPAITSLFDFPTNDPSFTEIGVPEFGFRGDIRYLGELGEGPLPNDRRHQFKVFGNYVFDQGVNIGVGIRAGSGRPLTALAAHPVFTNAGEIPEGPRGSGIQTFDGFRTRGEKEINIDLHGDYRINLPNDTRIVLLADVFNLFDLDQILDYDNFTETPFGVVNPDFGQPISNSTGQPAFQSPLRLRLGARFEF